MRTKTFARRPLAVGASLLCLAGFSSFIAAPALAQQGPVAPNGSATAAAVAGNAASAEKLDRVV
ncbi:MAG: hypothetical protein K2W93_12965, partial [Burkholderiaceae bacterium]|nr:hypothetical protein [Burkholderiaceae bacterium]